MSAHENSKSGLVSFAAIGNDQAFTTFLAQHSHPLLLNFLIPDHPLTNAMRRARRAVALAFSERLYVVEVDAMRCRRACKQFAVTVAPMLFLVVGQKVEWMKIGGLSSTDLVAALQLRL